MKINKCPRCKKKGTMYHLINVEAFEDKNDSANIIGGAWVCNACGRVTIEFWKKVKQIERKRKNR